MKANRLRLTVLISVILVVFSLAFTVVGVLTPSESFDEMTGFGKVFAASPEIGFDTGSLVITFGDYSLSINLTFDKPFFSLLSDAPVINLNILIFLLIIFAMIVSCVIPEISLATSGVMAIFIGIALGRLVELLKLQVADGVSAWDAAAGAFWFVSFLLAALIVNGMIGIGAKLINAIISDELVIILVTFLFSVVLANAISLVLCLFVYLTVGLGWCGGVMLWFVITLLFVLFLEIMDIISL